MVRRGYGRSLALKAEPNGPLPTEFRVLRAGVNDTTEGPIVFDDIAASAVMTRFAEHGVDIMIDVQHDSVDDAARATRSDAADARGWCALALRPAENPVEGAASDLWCVDVSWTPDGERRLRERTQRYVSPVLFFDDSGTPRVGEIFNIALVSMPATHHAAALVAARKLENRMDPKLIQEALDALIAGDAEAAMGILTKMIASAAGAAAPEEAPAAVDAAAEPPDPKPEDENAPAAMAAALASVLKVAANPTSLVAEVKRMRTELDALTLSRAADERNERLALIGSLVKLGAELPSTAWSNAEKLEPVPTLRDMPMATLRARVAAFSAAPRSNAVRPPVGPAENAVALSDEDRARAEKITDPNVRERFVAARLAHKGSK